MRSLGLLVLLAACASKPEMPVSPVPPHPEVTRCRPGMAQVPPPPLPRTIDSIVKAYNQAKLAGLITEEALRECSAKVDLLLSR